MFALSKNPESKLNLKEKRERGGSGAGVPQGPQALKRPACSSPRKPAGHRKADVTQNRKNPWAGEARPVPERPDFCPCDSLKYIFQN